MPTKMHNSINSMNRQNTNIPTRIKVIYIIDILTGNQGGTERQLIEIINGLDNRRFEKHLVCFDSSPWFQSNKSVFRCDSTIIHINQFHLASTYFRIFKLIRFVKDFNPDIVHTFFPVGNSVGVIVARLAGVRNIISSRRDYGEWMNGRYLLATGLANRFLKKIIANSSPVKKLKKKKERACNGKVEIILNGIDMSVFKKVEQDVELKKRLKIPEADKVVGIVANFRPMKHHYAFIKAAAEILKVRNDVSFLLLGAGEMQKELEALGESLNVRHKLHFAGPQRDVMPFLSIMDVGVNCSEMEGLSNAIMEYMSVGIPCVVSRAGGNPDLIEHNVNGYTFELDDYAALANLTLKLLDDEGIRQHFIMNSRKKIEKEMSLEAMLSQYEELYRSLQR